MESNSNKKEIKMTEKIVESIDIPAYKVSYLTKKIEKMNRKALKMGCDPLVLTFDNEHVLEYWDHPQTGHRLTSPIIIEMVTATLTYNIPIIEGYELVAKLDIFHGEDGNQVLISAVPDAVIPEKWQNATSIQCDHCGWNRNRHHSVLLREIETNEYKEVGSTCVKDFFGLDPSGFMFMASIKFHGIVGGIKDEDCMKGGRRIYSYPLNYVLGYASAVINQFGWASKKYAYDFGGNSTCNRVWDNLEPYRGMPRSEFVQISDEDHALADKVIEYYKNLDPEGNDYLLNLVKLAKLNYVPSKFMGFAVSMINSYKNAMERLENQKKREEELADAPESNYVGVIGERLKNVRVEVTFAKEIETMYGMSTLYAFKDALGNIFKTFYSGTSIELKNGDVVLLTGTVKKHNEYQGRKETMLNRIIVKDAPEELIAVEEFAVA